MFSMSVQPRCSLLIGLFSIAFAVGCGDGGAEGAPASGGQVGAASSSGTGGESANDPVGGSGNQDDASGGSAQDTTGGSGGTTSSTEGDYFITATIEGVERRMTTHLYGAVEPEVSPDKLVVAAKDDPTNTKVIWQIAFDHVTGVQQQPFINYRDHDYWVRSLWEFYPVSLELKATAPNLGDTIEGTFSGTFVKDASTGETVEVTDGHFRVKRVAPY